MNIKCAEATKAYLVCTLPRSGSWLLCNMLNASGVAGRPAEFFHAGLMSSPAPQSARYHLRSALRIGTSDNGVFGGKVHWSQFEHLMRMPDVVDQVGLSRLFSSELPRLRYVWLSRRDKARQAISYYRAIHTRAWWKLAREGKPMESVEPGFDFDTLERHERWLINQEAKWQEYFEGLDLDPLLILYEELAEDPNHALVATLKEFELDVGDAALVAPELVRQADATSDEWLERYIAMKARRLSISVRGPLHRSARAESPCAVNQREIRVAAIQRSGHHGVINWIAAQCEEPILFLNDARPSTNPFFTSTILSRLEPPTGAVHISRAMAEPFAPRACLIHNYEDRPLTAIFSEEFEDHHDGWVGRSLERSDVIVIRDPFNTFASRMNASWMRHRLTDQVERAAIIAMWKEYAREALGKTCLARHRRVVILFNRWVHDLEYRQELAALLGLRFSDAGLRKVSPEYGGSSFDGVGFDGRADTMRLTERWRHFVDDSSFREIFADPELLDLSDALFGIVPGTEKLRPETHTTVQTVVSRQNGALKNAILQAYSDSERG